MAILPKAEMTNSRIGENSFFDGKFMINGSLQIDGKFEGSVLAVDHLFIGPKGKVKTDIKASTVVVEGIVIGSITATNRVILNPTAKVLGDIVTPELFIQNGVVLEGKCIIKTGSGISAGQLIKKLYEKD